GLLHKNPRTGRAGRAGRGGRDHPSALWGSMMKSMRLPGEAHTIEAMAVEHLAVEPFEAGRDDANGPRWPIPPVRGEAASLGARLSELLAQETPDALLGRLAVFKQSVEEALRRSSSAFHILRELEESGLKDCARCTREL